MTRRKQGVEVRTKLKGIYVLPALVVVGVAVVGLVTAGTAAHGATRAANHAVDDRRTAGGVAIQRIDPITYHLPPASYIAPGHVLFEQNCSSCHGSDAAGTAVPGGPNLRGVGAATVDFWVSTGRMPLADSSQQPVRKPPRFDRRETLEIAAFVASLAPPSESGPAIPTVDLRGASLSEGNTLFVLNCAACHTITGSGDALADGYFAPSLHKATKTQVAEAIRTGPGNMPQFGRGTLSDREAADIVAYVTGPIQHPNDRGGFGLGGVGPVAEGFVGLLVGVGGVVLIAYWIGDRA